MKPSQYNIFFTSENQIVGYNSYENDYIFLVPELYELYLKHANHNIDSLEQVYPDFYKLLKQKGFCVPNDTDELQKVKELVQLVDGNDELYHIIINPTMNCNFKCWYCYETHIKDSKMEKGEIKKILNFIDSTLKNVKIKSLSLSWFGGEPLLYFKKVVLPILKHTNTIVTEKGINFNSDFTSNGLLITDELLSECKQLGVTSFQITLDGHRKRHNEVRFVTKEKGTYDVIVANIKLCLKYGMRVTCRINLSKDTFNEDLTQIIDDFTDITDENKELLNFFFNQVWQEECDLNTEILNIIQLFKDKKFQTQYNKFIDTVRISCYGDKKNQATINYNGDVFKCTARDFKTENREGVLMDDGTIEWNEKYYQRMNAKFNNPPCLVCNILPICNGSCSQQALEKVNVDYCTHNFDEDKKIDIIKEKLLYAIS